MNSENVVIVNQDKFDFVKKQIAASGADSLQVVSDFDKTLTRCFVNGKKIASVISILRDEKYLTPDYAARAQALYDYYHPFEVDTQLSFEEKTKLMHEWWAKHYEILIECKLNKNDLLRVAKSNKLELRPGVREFLGFLHKHAIPLVILSSAGVGTDAIELYLEEQHQDLSNIHIVSNRFVWDELDNLKSVVEPIIHTFNKDYSAVKKYSFYADLAKRRNVILLGDGVGDASMINGFEYDHVLKVGFLNEDELGELTKYEANYDVVILHDGSIDPVLDSFKNVFDVVVVGDGPMSFVNSLLRDLVVNIQSKLA